MPTLIEMVFFSFFDKTAFSNKVLLAQLLGLFSKNLVGALIRLKTNIIGQGGNAPPVSFNITGGTNIKKRSNLVSKNGANMTSHETIFWQISSVLTALRITTYLDTRSDYILPCPRRFS